MLTHLLMIVLFAVFAGLPLFYAWRVFRLDEAARGGWLVRVAEAALLLLLFLALGRWDMAGPLYALGARRAAGRGRAAFLAASCVPAVARRGGAVLLAGSSLAARGHRDPGRPSRLDRARNLLRACAACASLPARGRALRRRAGRRPHAPQSPLRPSRAALRRRHRRRRPGGFPRAGSPAGRSLALYDLRSPRGEPLCGRRGGGGGRASRPSSAAHGSRESRRQPCRGPLRGEGHPRSPRASSAGEASRWRKARGSRRAISSVLPAIPAIPASRISTSMRSMRQRALGVPMAFDGRVPLRNRLFRR